MQHVSYDLFVEAELSLAKHTPKTHYKSHVGHFDDPTASPPASVDYPRSCA